MKKIKIILGIETSCDETAVSLLRIENNNTVTFLEEMVYSQIKEHEKFGGVVPELAARKHLEVLPLMLEDVRDKTKFDFSKLDAIAVTNGPGLVTSLMVGLDAAKTLGVLYNIPLIPVNHLEGHILSSLLMGRGHTFQQISFPALGLVVSGGHTELVVLKSYTHFVRVGQTLDDAAGEAYDKVAKLLGLGYPGGPVIEKAARSGDAEAFTFPRPMSKHQTLDFSYAGLKTAVRLAILQSKKKRMNEQFIADVSASFQQAVSESLMMKLERAIGVYSPKTILFGGGVANNSVIRSAFLKVGKDKKVSSLICPKKYAGDNASMIAFSGFFNLKRSVSLKNFYKIKADPQLTYKK